MRFAAEPISDLRLTRFHRWAMLWLKWFVAFLANAEVFAPLSKPAEAVGHHWLGRIERIIISIVMLRAAPRVRRLHLRKGVAEYRLSNTSLSRAVIGSRMRRTMRPNDLRQRIEALTQSIGALVAQLLKRLPRGLTRRRPIRARREARAIALHGENPNCAPLSDTS